LLDLECNSVQGSRVTVKLRRLSLTVSLLKAGNAAGEHLVLPSDAVHSIDSEELCASDDLTSLNHLNEPNIIHGLGIRFRRFCPPSRPIYAHHTHAI
jgi:hypothetical protein